AHDAPPGSRSANRYQPAPGGRRPHFLLPPGALFTSKVRTRHRQLYSNVVGSLVASTTRNLNPDPVRPLRRPTAFGRSLNFRVRRSTTLLRASHCRQSASGWVALAVTRQGSHGPGRACINASGSSADRLALPEGSPRLSERVPWTG